MKTDVLFMNIAHQTSIKSTCEKKNAPDLVGSKNEVGGTTNQK
jgi:hypothetical protein